MGILRNVCEFMIDEGDIVLGIAPQFSRFISEVELQRGVYTFYSLCSDENYKFNVEEFIDKITNDVTMIYIDNPNNPTGQIIEISDINKICKIAHEKGIYVLIDEAYGDYMPTSTSAINLVNLYNNLIVIKSASKVYGLADQRIGYIVSSKEIIEIYNKVLVPFPFSELAMKKFIKALNNRDKYIRKIKKIPKYKNKILSELNEDDYLYTSMNTPIFTVKSNKYKNLSYEFMQNNMLVEGCECFLNLDSQYARIRMNKDYKKILTKIKKIL